MTNHPFASAVGRPMSQYSPSPLGRWLDGTLETIEEKSLTVTFIVREDMCNPGGVLHGGTAAAMMDDVMGMTVFALGLEYFFTSVNLTVDFLYSARPGQTLSVRSEVIRLGKKIVHLECRITDTDQKVIAKSSSNLMATSQPNTLTNRSV